MLLRLRWMFFGVVATIVAVTAASAMGGSYNDVVNNLQRSRDALLNQQAELQRAYDETQKQVDVLNQKLARIDSYMKQVDQSVRDVNRSIDQYK